MSFVRVCEQVTLRSSSWRSRLQRICWPDNQNSLEWPRDCQGRASRRLRHLLCRQQWLPLMPPTSRSLHVVPAAPSEAAPTCSSPFISRAASSNKLTSLAATPLGGGRMDHTGRSSWGTPHTLDEDTCTRAPFLQILAGSRFCAAPMQRNVQNHRQAPRVRART